MLEWIQRSTETAVRSVRYYWWGRSLELIVPSNEVSMERTFFTVQQRTATFFNAAVQDSPLFGFVGWSDLVGSVLPLY